MAGGSRFLLCVLVAAWSLAARAADEDAVLAVWKQIMAAPNDHETALKACRDYAAAHAADPLAPVVRGLQEWNLMCTGRRADALTMMAADDAASPDPPAEGARRLAQAWLTRDDRDQLAAALQAYYRKQIAYPESLNQLPPDSRPRPEDRFGKPWDYKLTGFARLPGFSDQSYTLRSAVLGASSDFQAALKMPYASGISAVPVQIVAVPGGGQAVKFTDAGSASVIGVGQASRDLYLAFIGSQILVVCDSMHWKIFPRP